MKIDHGIDPGLCPLFYDRCRCADIPYDQLYYIYMAAGWEKMFLSPEGAD